MNFLNRNLENNRTYIKNNFIINFIQKGANNWDMGMRGTARGGSLDLVKFFTDKGAKDWDWNIQHTKHGDKNLIEFFKQKLKIEILKIKT